MSTGGVCHQCGKENRKGSAFCRHCGAKLERKNNQLSTTFLSSFFVKAWVSVKKFCIKVWYKIPLNKKLFANKSVVVIIVLAVLFVSAGIAYASPKIGDYMAVNAAIGTAQKLQTEGSYTAALNTLNGAEGKWALSSTKKNLETLKTQEIAYVQDQANFDLAVSEEKSGNLQGAVKTLQSISNTFPTYNKVQSEISTVQSEIEGQLQNQTQQAEDQAKAAQAEQVKSAAAAAQAAQAKIQAEAEAAAAAQAQSQADAAAATAAAAAAQAQAETQHQVLVSFYNQLQSIYTSVNGDGISYYNNGLNYYEEGTTLGDLDAISTLGQAEAVDRTAYNDATNLNNFTNMPSGYIGAGENMAAAANDCYQAASTLMTDAGDASSGTYISPNTYSNECNSLMGDVSSFLQTTTP
jgi:hypothetical protein